MASASPPALISMNMALALIASACSSSGKPEDNFSNVLLAPKNDLSEFMTAMSVIMMLKICTSLPLIHIINVVIAILVPGA
eukprot:CAMPEP_0174333430 /NCGR_PEP_ID=MMETSP0810-20121108/19148_1 /TAXON_ID=73025 ORGANISM="Eutreptiella gymnastica-like, Strain CCMP1594" /NCGR_SAMPLE_ID=MMETSP0810 /ASSEMBLY_ACC=CAM_ASM_000659 /LENGTH=80 /DNA_ID=CAMNT_0015450547 /DNA_START=13 /DNA_END=255 /DNA_ORIENTATION=-